jgi:UDP-3-O-[3-hydroxymyristoyl] glucosamine N-acyltransferase
MVKEKHIAFLNQSLIDETAVISPTSKIGENVVIGKNVVIKDFVIIESNTVIGNDCEIEPFAVIGASSMQRTIIDNQLFHLEYAGGVKIGERTRILTGAIIQKPYQSFYTTIGNDSVISTKVVIGHGCKVGDRCLLSGNSAVAGNCTIANDVWIGGGAMISDGISIGEKAQVLIGSVVVRNVEDKEIVSGNFALDHKKNIKYQIRIKHETY